MRQTSISKNNIWPEFPCENQNKLFNRALLVKSSMSERIFSKMSQLSHLPDYLTSSDETVSAVLTGNIGI